MAGPKKECFVVSVIGEEGSPQRLHADWVLDGIIKPTFDEHFKDYKVVRADHMNTPGLIDAQIIDKLLNADLVIADLTFQNPNAFYEIGIRHVVAKPIIHMNLATERIPFDISLYLSLKFSIAHPSDLVKARAGLKGMVDSVLSEGYEVENPVTKARGRVKFEETATPVDRILQTELENITDRLASVERHLRPNHERVFLDDSRRVIEWNVPYPTLRFENRTGNPAQIAVFSKTVLNRFMDESHSAHTLREDENAVEIEFMQMPPMKEVERLRDMAKKMGLEMKQIKS